jgi:hypothetical protein
MGNKESKTTSSKTKVEEDAGTALPLSESGSLLGTPIGSADDSGFSSSGSNKYIINMEGWHDTEDESEHVVPPKSSSELYTDLDKGNVLGAAAVDLGAWAQRKDQMAQEAIKEEMAKNNHLTEENKRLRDENAGLRHDLEYATSKPRERGFFETLFRCNDK